MAGCGWTCPPAWRATWWCRTCPALLRDHPLLEIELSSTERRVDLVREGFDCVLRTGSVQDASLVARPLGQLRMVNAASPAYLAAHGTPHTLDDLAAHRLVHFAGVLGAKPLGFEYMDGAQDRFLSMAGAVTVNNAEAYHAACLAGLGIIQVPVLGVVESLAVGRVVPVLPRHVARPMR